jgi:methylmalonyl-CoA/ethylmalonyl-CoA epimerase
MMHEKDCLFPFLQKGITQVAWVVEDVDASVEHFYHTFGIGPWYYYMYGPPLLKMMRRNGKDVVYSMKTAAADAGPLRVELIQPLEGDTVYNDFIQRYGYGKVQHFGLAVENMEEALKIVRKAGIEVTMEGSGYGLDGDGYFAYLDTERIIGITLELMERPKRRHVPYKVYPLPTS